MFKYKLTYLSIKAIYKSSRRGLFITSHNTRDINLKEIRYLLSLVKKS